MQLIKKESINKAGYHPTVETRGYSRPKYRKKIAPITTSEPHCAVLRSESGEAA